MYGGKVSWIYGGTTKVLKVAHNPMFLIAHYNTHKRFVERFSVFYTSGIEKKYNQWGGHKGFGLSHVFIICNIKLEKKLHKMKQTYPHLDTILCQYYSLPLSPYLNKKSFVGLRSLPFEVVYLHIADVTFGYLLR